MRRGHARPMVQTKGGAAAPGRDSHGLILLWDHLAREVNLYVLFMHTWSAMGYAVSPEVINELLAFQGDLLKARGRPEAIAALAVREEGVFNLMVKEIKRFKEESEEFFPSAKMKFDPCF